GAMPDYAGQLTPADRWAVAAYIRALQYSQAASMADVPPGVQVQSLKSVAQQQGLPEGFAEPWSLPTTAVEPAKPITSEGTPGMAPAVPASPKILIPATLPPSAAHK